MRINWIAIIICLFLSCNINRNLKTLKYPVDNNGHKLILKIPKGYYFSNTHWEHINDGYKYSDSSIIYVTSESNGGINYDNIEAAGLKSELFRAFLDKDTITLNGVDKKGFFWRHSTIGTYGVGYKNVSNARKAEFDKVIDSARVQ